MIRRGIPIVTWLLGERCSACGRPGSVLCGSCGDLVRPAPRLPDIGGIDRCLALMAFEGVARELVLGLKYRNHRLVVDRVAGALALLACRDPAAAALLEGSRARPVARVGVGAPLVTWAPTSRQRRLQRGYDQSELLARGVARHLGLQCRGLLCRRPGPPQTGRSLVARQQDLHFEYRGPVGTGVVLVDDVITTGTTLRSAAAAVTAGSGGWILGLAAAQTPLKVAGAGAEY